MDDLISRQAAIDAFEKHSHLDWERLKILYPLLEEIEQLPSVSTEKTGRWIDGTDCSCCGFAFYDDVTDSKLLVGFKYCPNCGVKMDGGKMEK